MKLSLGKTRVKKKQVEMMIGQNIITRVYHTTSVTAFSVVNQLCCAVPFMSNHKNLPFMSITANYFPECCLEVSLITVLNEQC